MRVDPTRKYNLAGKENGGIRKEIHGQWRERVACFVFGCCVLLRGVTCRLRSWKSESNNSFGYLKLGLLKIRFFSFDASQNDTVVKQFQNQRY